MKLRITMTPSEPYFFGTERCAVFAGDDNATQRSLVNPYFLTSNLLPSQTALFGITRFLGIRNPRADGSVSPETMEQIGRRSFQLLSPPGGAQPFGKIKDISPLMLRRTRDGEVRHYLPEPLNYAPDDQGGKNFTAYRSVNTLSGERWLPMDYSAKNTAGGGYICVETGERIAVPFKAAGEKSDAPFIKQVRVGINRTTGPDTSTPGGFFKKEYICMDPDFAFTWTANLTEDAFDGDHGFTERGSRLVFSGQGKAGFAAQWEPDAENAATPNTAGLVRCFPKTITVDGTERNVVCYAYAASPIYYEGDPAELQAHCQFIMAGTVDHRSFATNSSEKNMSRRFTKGKEGVKLIAPGSVFLFRDEAQRGEFTAQIESGRYYDHGKTAGLNHIIYF